jgi:START domain
MKKLLLHVTFIFSALLLNAQSAPCGEWKNHSVKGSCKVFVRECPDSPVKEFKVLDQFQGNFETLKKVMDDVQTTKRMSENCKEAIFLKKLNANTVLQYFYFDLPMGINDRDIVSKNTTYETATTYLSISEVYNEHKVTLREGVIRLSNVRSSFYFEKLPNGTIKMEYIARADPNGWIPAFLVNMLAGNQAIKMVDKLKEMIRF